MQNKTNDSKKELSSRKLHHIELAEQAQLGNDQKIKHFNYEPLLASHPGNDEYYQKKMSFFGKSVKAPLWISSMTGGTGPARHINQNLAQAAREFGLGMGLGSCRPLLDSDEFFEDFNLRSIIGEEVPFFANLGIAQVEQLLEEGRVGRLEELVKRLQSDGLFIHINPFQEWLQPEGDRLKFSPLETLENLLSKTKIPIAIKEVGQGMGPKSLRAALQLPLVGIEFAAFGGTNFSYLESLRAGNLKESKAYSSYEKLAFVGQGVDEMVIDVNQILEELGPRALCQEFIISGGVSSFLQGHCLIKGLKAKSVYGQASSLLGHAAGDYEQLRSFVHGELMGLEMAERFLTLKE